MANKNPNISGLTPLNQRSEEDRKRIQVQGILAAKKKREAELIFKNGLKKAVKAYMDTYGKDPIQDAYFKLLKDATYTESKNRCKSIQALENSFIKYSEMDSKFVEDVYRIYEEDSQKADAVIEETLSKEEPDLTSEDLQDREGRYACIDLDNYFV